VEFAESLPASSPCKLDRLKAFVELLPEHRYTVELRHESWWTEEVYAYLRSRNIAFCLFHLAGRETPEIVTADFVYIRLHGPGAAYQGSYSDETLRDWQGKIERWRGEGRDVYIYFDNDEKAYAAEDARRLQEWVKG
jgi:uncharacterized protein YecE (DUF72 family)